MHEPCSRLAGTRAALLFGAGTPLAKLLVGQMPPLRLAGLLYLGSGLGLALLLLLHVTHDPAAAHALRIPARDCPWLLVAIACGGLVGPALLMGGVGAHRRRQRRAAAQRRRRADGSGCLVGLQGERRSAHRAGHGGDRRRRRAAGRIVDQAPGIERASESIARAGFGEVMRCRP